MASRRAHGRRRRNAAAERLIVGGPHAVAAAVDGGAKVSQVFVEQGGGARAAAIGRAAQAKGLRVGPVGEGECDRLAGVRAQGIAAEIEYGYADLAELLAAAPQHSSLLIFLDGIEDPHNLGAIIRTADAAGCAGVVIPARRSAQVTSAVVRASAGAALSVPVCRVANLVQAVVAARRAGVWITGLDGQAQGLLDRGLEGRRQALVVGAEGRGLGRLVAEKCDEISRLPMIGSVESLNASVAAGLAIYRLCEKRLFA